MRVFVNDIETNMIIDEDIFNDKGNLILSRGLSVTDDKALKNLLIKNGINKVKVLKLSEEVSLKQKKIDPITTQIYSEEKKLEIEDFISGLNETVDSFEKEIICTMTGMCDKMKLDEILENTLKSSLEKNTNIFQLLQKIKNSDDLTFVHCTSVSLTAHMIGKWINLPAQTVNELSLAGLLFDVGKFSIPDEIMKKPATLSDDEFEIVKTHVDESLKILKPYNLSTNIIDAIKYHHERCDGTGYPYGLSNEDIPLMAKILSIADVFVALTSKRPYREKLTPFDAVKVMETDFMQKLDITVLTEFIRRIFSNYIGNYVRLSNGTHGEVMFVNANFPLRPLIRDLETDELIDLSSKSNSTITILEFL